MKTLKDWTPEIEAKIPQYIERYTRGIFDGQRYKDFKREDAVALINWNYEKSGFKKPFVLVAENPYEAQLFFNYIKDNSERFLPLIYSNYCLVNGIELPKDSFNVKENNAKVELQLYPEINYQLCEQLESQNAHTNAKIDSQINSQLDFPLISQIRSHLESQLLSNLDSQLYSQLDSELISQLDSQLDIQLYYQSRDYNDDYLFTANIRSNILLACLKFIKDEFKIEAEIGIELDLWNNLYEKSGVYSALFSELICIVSKYPKSILRNNTHDLHAIDQPAVNWGASTETTQFNRYYLNGRNVPDWVFEDFESEAYFSKFLEEENEDIKAAIITLVKEKNGPEGLLKALSAELVDEDEISHFEGYSEIYEMKTLKDWTPEIAAKVPQYIERYTRGIFDGQRYKDFKRENAVALINWNYEKSGFKNPFVLVAENPYEAQMFFNYIKDNSQYFLPLIYSNYCLVNEIEFKKDLFNVEENKAQIYLQLCTPINYQLRKQLESQLESPIIAHTNGKIDSQLNPKLFSQLKPHLEDQLGDLGDQLDTQLESQLYDQQGSQLDAHTEAKIHSHINAQLCSPLNPPLDTQIGSRPNSQLASELGQYNEDYLFTVNIRSNAELAWFKFIKDEFKIESEIGIELDLWNDLYEKSGVYSAIFSEFICIVSKYPKSISRNSANDLHAIDKQAVNWGASTEITKLNCYYVNGRNVPDWVFEEFESEEYFSKFLEEENEDVKAAVITLVKERNGQQGLLKFLSAELVDQKEISHFEGYSETVRLYKTKEKYSFLQDRFGNMDQPYCWTEITCPSTNSVYLIDNSADFTCAKKALEFLRPAFVPEGLEYKWEHSAN